MKLFLLLFRTLFKSFKLKFKTLLLKHLHSKEPLEIFIQQKHLTRGFEMTSLHLIISNLQISEKMKSIHEFH